MRRRTTTGIIVAGVAAVAGLTVLAFAGKWGGSGADADIAGYWVPSASYETSPYLDVQKDGSFTSSDGCNTVSGTWSIDGEKLSVEAGPSTLIACDGAPLPTYFATAATAHLSDGALELRDDDGAVLVALVAGAPIPETPAAEVGPDPALEASYTGTWTGEAAGGKVPTLELAADGTMSGNDGCNNLHGSWSVSDGVLMFGPIASTRMACEGVDPWLANVTSASLDGDDLVFRGMDDELLGTLTRS